MSPILFNLAFGALAFGALALFFRDPCRRPHLALAILFTGLIFVAGVVFVMPDIQFWPNLAIANVNLALAYLFGHRVACNNSSILAEFVEHVHRGPALSAEFSGFLRRQCIAWLVFALCTATLAFAAIFAVWFSAIVLAALLGVQILWFVVSHKIAQYTYDRPERWQITLSLALNRDHWAMLEI